MGESPEILAAFKTVQQVASSSASVLLLGESGTGKELFAQAIHENSPRRNKPFVKVACAALPETLLESELFGHEKGAFTGALYARAGRFEAADGGTLFLDEIGDISPTVQVKLLRVLEEREFERVGGNRTFTGGRAHRGRHPPRPARRRSRTGTFREDLYYRLNVMRDPACRALRERRGDIPLLAHHFLKKLRGRRTRRMCAASPTRRWPCSCAIPGPATCASWRTPSSARWCSARSRCCTPCISRPSRRAAVLCRRRRDRPRRASPSRAARFEDIEREAILRTLEAVGGSTLRAAEILRRSARARSSTR